MALFTLVVVALAAMVLLVRNRLVPEHEVDVDVNGQRTLHVMSGDRLLWTLAEAGIVLPAACGGRGSCGQCRLRVLDGGGPPLPIEENHISRREAARGERLACMVMVHDDLRVEVPAALLSARPRSCRLAQARFLAPLLKELTFELPDGAPMRYQAGDWVLLHAPACRVELAEVAVDERYESDWAALRELSVSLPEPEVRAYSLASHPGEEGILKLVIRLATPPPTAPADAPPGKVSSWAFSLTTGASATVSGPFGDFHLRDTEREKVFIGGGAGIAPMRSMILDLLENRHSQAPMSFWYGARNAREVCYRDEFSELARAHGNFSYRVALSEPEHPESWDGATGFIHRVVLDEYLGGHRAPEEAEYYLCGPPVMRRAVITMLEDLGVDRTSILFDDFAG